MTKRSNPTRNVPHPAPFGGGGVDGMRSRSDFAGSTARLKRRTAKRGDARPRPSPPRPPPLFNLHDDANDRSEPQPIYGQYPRGLIAKLLPLLGCERREILHVCSGALPRGEGVRVDIRPAAQPDILADGRALPIASGSIAAVMLDPPYCEDYARSLYGVEYPRPAHLLAEAARVVRPGGRIAFVHYIVPPPPAGTRVVRILGMSIGFNMPMRALAIFERDQAELDLGVA